MVLTEYVPYGDLLGYLRKSRGLDDTYYKDPDIKPQSSLSSKQLFGFSWDIASGMEFLSSKKVPVSVFRTSKFKIDMSENRDTNVSPNVDTLLGDMRQI